MFLRKHVKNIPVNFNTLKHPKRHLPCGFCPLLKKIFRQPIPERILRLPENFWKIIKKENLAPTKLNIFQ